MIPERLGSLMAALAVAVAPLISDAHAQATSPDAAVGPLRLIGDEPSYLDLGAGAFNIRGHGSSSTSGEGRVEFRYGKKLFYLGPAIGLLGNTQGGVFGYAGVYTDIALGRFVLTPLGAIGGYHRGGGEDLGGTFQFRLSANLSYEFNDDSRLGLQFAHISDAGISNHNPGDNEVLVTYAIPLHLPF